VSTSNGRATVVRVRDGVLSPAQGDHVAIEEPMELRVTVARRTSTVAVTMRTPGADFELAAGFLFAEGIIRSERQVRAIRYCTDEDVDEAARYNVVTADLRDVAEDDLARLDRHFYVSSACGVCGKESRARV
jgi:FdhD protein